jgi:PAS domain S-box-containing protein
MTKRADHGTPDRRSRVRARDALLFLVVSGAYVGAAKLGLSLDVSHGVITPVWAPSGIALAALLILGVRFWPAVAVGAFVANATSDASLGVAAGITVGNTAAAVVGALLVRRLGFTPALDRVRSVLALVVGGALLSTLISATNGVTVLTIADATEDPYRTAWVLWWFGDAIGVLMVAPVILVLYASRHVRPTPWQVAEGLAVLGAVAAVSSIVFLAGAWRYPYLIFPLLLWSALRFRQIGAASASFLVGAIGTWGAVEGEIPLGGDTATERVQLAQALFAVVVVSLLVLAATLAERESGRAALAQVAARLAEAQSIAHIGSWEWNIRSDAITWSDELYRIFGLEQGTAPLSYSPYLERVHPEDRARVDETVRQALADGQPFAVEHRVVRLDGSERVVAGRGRALFDGDEPVSMVGTAQDVTEQRQVDRLREDILSAVSHELRTPLTSVLGFALTLQERRSELDEETVNEIVVDIAQAARRLERLLADLLDIERLRLGHTVVRREPVDVSDLVRRVVADYPLGDRVVSITGGPVAASLDSAKMERIVDNLVVNAAKHTPPEAPIEIRVDTRDRDLLLVVEDEGPGIADEYKLEVFETFNRGPNVASMTPGAGIGLALVSRFAAIHGGRTWVEDAPGGGASFHVLIPDCVLDVAATVD